ncbi:hypothetical protein [Pseudoxanthomonas kaohsiungensis]|uniref:Uncharacterized protein n=1 Tax=Pseudoxanthomonas kaohsiungensis TaxID=283923 RepID=A0ABW3LZX5_9GAMM|nr:hypothetical protein [Pseudoxanthomonas kaohsiungensis]KAF1702887.1 hypothetical protein CSC66_08930 [Pseudoxanthomonas kaohsiungensis]
MSTQPHYSDLTLQALIDNHGWEPAYSLGPNKELSSVRRSFVGVGALGGTTIPDGTRRLHVGYELDGDRRRYVSLTLGDSTIVSLDGRDASPAEIAMLVNLKAEQYADARREHNRLKPIYAVGAPALTLPFGDPDALAHKAAAAARYYEQKFVARFADALRGMLSHDARLNAAEKAPDGDDYNQVLSLALDVRRELTAFDALRAAPAIAEQGEDELEATSGMRP